MRATKIVGGLEFQNILVFNKTLLAKQLWRLMQQPNSLVCPILKHKYFQHGSDLETKVGFKHSFIWRSLLASLDQLKDGLYWRLGKGQKVHIWRDKWLPSPTSFKVQSQSRCYLRMYWFPLLYQTSVEWNANLIQQIFIKEKVDKIFSIPTCRFGAYDILIWRHTKEDIFTMKSAYDLELECISNT